jgi:hypothetical protein
VVKRREDILQQPATGGITLSARHLLLLVAFIEGAAVMAVELAGFYCNPLFNSYSKIIKNYITGISNILKLSLTTASIEKDKVYDGLMLKSLICL